MLIRGFKKFLRKKNFLRQRDNKKNEGKRTKEVICYECKKPGQIRSECLRLKFKGKGIKENKKAFKSTWDNSSNSKKKEKNQEVANICFMALEDKEVPSTSNSSCCDDDELDYDDDDESSIMSKLVLKCKNLLLKKRFYK